MHDMAARVHDERVRSRQCLDFLEQEQPLLATRHQARSGPVQDVECALDLGRQRGDACLVRGAVGPSEGRARHVRPEAPDRDPRGHQLVNGSRRGRQRRGVELGEPALGLVDAPDQEEAPDLEMTRVRGVHPVAVLLEHRPRRVERLGRPSEVARGERDLGLGNHTPRPGHGLFATEGTRSAAEKNPGPDEIAELRHRDASKRESRRVVAQGDPLQSAEGIAGRERTRRGSDQ